ncbi:Fic family protein [Noviherbaspirillum galbum]|uniref:Fic family protein n=1 Tax=Noviherbaspirillum galbum TaxID=2709383 RepID=A0A6B3SWL9_9BURK|nr:Fic family protein [Noviherbaspirillum galbum]NEX64908.1 Fic family protein [Noviherbaspirillum galbum]
MTLSPQYIWQRVDWPRFRFDHSRLLPTVAAARRAQGILLGKASAIGLHALPGAENEVWVSEAIATAAIEGEKLNLDAVRSSVARRLGLQNPPAGPVSRHVEGLLDAMADASRHWEEPLSRDRLCSWQAALFPTGYSSIRQIKVGDFRTDPIAVMSGPEGRETSHYEAPPAEQLESEVGTFLTWFNRTRAGEDTADIDGLVRAGLAHLWFETLHPFEDGNGRVGRAIIDMALAQDIQQATRLFGISRRMATARDEYYLQLERAQKGDLDVTEWICWFTDQFKLACEESALILDRSLEKAQFWAEHAGKSLSEAQRKVVNVLLDAGPQGFDGGMSTRKYGSLARVSPATASRDLGALARLGMLTITGQGKSTRYWINLDGWVKERVTGE